MVFEQRKVRVGETFEIRLDANPSTGFAWQVSCDANSLKLVNKTFDRASNSMGAGGTDVWKFEALRAGNSNLTFELRRSWEKDVQAARVYEIEVQP